MPQLNLLLRLALNRPAFTLIYANMNTPEHQKIADFYDHIYYRDVSSDLRPSAHLTRLADHIHISPGQHVLDVACGTGAWLATAARRGAIISGIDLSKTAIDVCQQRLPESDLHVGPAETLPFPDNTFDVVSCLGSLEHFLDQPLAVREMARVAKPDAQILILVPNAGFLPYRMKLYTGTHQQAAQETIRSLDEWKELFQNAGLQVEDRWKDLHILSRAWIFRRPWLVMPFRLLQALALPAWPLSWQYQVYHLCRNRA